MYAKDINLIFGMSQIYTCTDTQTHAHTSAEIPAHTDTDTCSQTYISTHAYIHRHTCIFFTYTNTHAYMSGSILPAHFIFSCHLPNELRSSWTYFLFQEILLSKQKTSSLMRGSFYPSNHFIIKCKFIWYKFCVIVMYVFPVFSNLCFYQMFFIFVHQILFFSKQVQPIKQLTFQSAINSQMFNDKNSGH